MEYWFTNVGKSIKKKQEDHSGPVSLPWDTIANYMGMAVILTFKS